MIKLYRPVNDKELALIEESGWTKFPQRLPEQPIFYPVLNIEYAMQISKEWNVPAYGCGFVLEFDISDDYVNQFDIKNVGGEVHNEIWVPSEEMDTFNDNIIGKIRLVKSYFK